MMGNIFRTDKRKQFFTQQVIKLQNSLPVGELDRFIEDVSISGYSLWCLKGTSRSRGNKPLNIRIRREQQGKKDLGIYALWGGSLWKLVGCCMKWDVG